MKFVCFSLKGLVLNEREGLIICKFTQSLRHNQYCRPVFFIKIHHNSHHITTLFHADCKQTAMRQPS